MPLSWQQVDDPGEFVYHYTTRQAALGSILPSGRIRLGLYRYMNDPRESKDWWFTLRGGNPANIGDFAATMRAASQHAKATSKVLSMTCDDPVGLAMAPREIFGRGFAHSRMWAHYAGAHTGACLVFDREALTAEIESALKPDGVVSHLYAGAVEYDNFPPEEVDAREMSGTRLEEVGVAAAVDEHLADWHPILFFRKALDWASEFEYRWIFRSPTPAPEYVPIGSSLRGVVLGADFPDSDIDSVTYLAESFDALHVGKMIWWNGVPRVGTMPGAAAAPMFDTIINVETPGPPPPSLELLPNEP